MVALMDGSSMTGGTIWQELLAALPSFFENDLSPSIRYRTKSPFSLSSSVSANLAL